MSPYDEDDGYDTSRKVFVLGLVLAAIGGAYVGWQIGGPQEGRGGPGREGWELEAAASGAIGSALTWAAFYVFSRIVLGEVKSKFARDVVDAIPWLILALILAASVVERQATNR